MITKYTGTADRHAKLGFLLVLLSGKLTEPIFEALSIALENPTFKERSHKPSEVSRSVAARLKLKDKIYRHTNIKTLPGAH